MHSDLTKGSTRAHLIKLSIPAMTGYFFHTMYNFTDTYFAGIISTQALTALSLSASIFFMILAIAIGMSEALTSLVANTLGAQQTKQAQHIALNGIAFAFVLSILLSIVGLISLPYFINIIKDASAISATLSYLNIIIYSIIFFIGSYFFNALLNATGDTKSFRNILIVTAFLNVLLDYIFVLHLNYGIQGLAIATVISEVITFLYLFYKLTRTKLYLGIRAYNFDIKIFKQLLNQGFAPSMNMFMMAFGMYIITYFVAPYGKEAIAAFGIGMRIEQIFLMPIVGLSIATLTIISQNNGAKQFARIEETSKLAIFYGTVLSSIGILIFYTFGENIASILTDDIKVIQQSVWYLKVCGFSFFGFVLIFIYIAVLQGVQKPSVIFPISIYRQVLAPILLFSFLQYLDVSITFVWIGLDVIILSSALFLWWYVKKVSAKLF